MIAPLINLNIGKWKEGEEEEGGRLPALSMLLVSKLRLNPLSPRRIILACDGALNGRALGTEHLIQ